MEFRGFETAAIYLIQQPKRHIMTLAINILRIGVTMKQPIVFLLCFTMISMNVVCFADPNLSDTENYKKGAELHTQGKYQDAYDLYFKDMNKTPKNIKWLQDYKAEHKLKGSDDYEAQPLISPLPNGGNVNIADNCSLGVQDATTDSKKVGGGNLVGGLVLGFTLNLIGACIAVVAAGPSQPPASALAGKNAEYSNCYTKTYLNETETRKTKKALLGGVLGVVAGAVVLGVGLSKL